MIGHTSAILSKSIAHCTILSKEVRKRARYLIQGQNANGLSYPRAKCTCAILSKDIAQRLGAALARQSGQDEDEAVRHLWGKLAILLQRGNAAILGNRVPDFPAPAIDGRY